MVKSHQVISISEVCLSIGQRPRQWPTATSLPCLFKRRKANEAPEAIGGCEEGSQVGRNASLESREPALYRHLCFSDESALSFDDSCEEQQVTGWKPRRAGRDVPHWVSRNGNACYFRQLTLCLRRLRASIRVLRIYLFRGCVWPRDRVAFQLSWKT